MIRITKSRSVWVAVWVIASVIVVSQGEAQERFTPLVFDGAASLDFAPDPRFELSGSGTIELLLRIDLPADTTLPEVRPSTRTHVVRSGETLSQIAIDHDVTLEQLLRANPVVRDPDVISVGQVLIVSPGANPRPVTQPRTLPAATLVANGDSSDVRYAVLLGENGGRIGFSDGERSLWVDAALTDGETHHLALVTEAGSTRLYLDGDFVGPRLNVGYGSAEGLPFHIGSSDGQDDFFQGSISSVRLWNRALSPTELNGLGGPGLPTAAQSEAGDLVAYTVFGTQDQTLHFAPHPVEGITEIFGGAGTMVSRSIPLGTSVATVEVSLGPRRVVGVTLLDREDVEIVSLGLQSENRESFALEAGEEITAIAGTFDDRLRSVRLVTNRRLSPVYRPARPGSETFLLRIPGGTRFSGLTGRVADGRLNAIGLGYRGPGDGEAVHWLTWDADHVLSPPTTDLGIWLPENAGQPTRNDNLAIVRQHQDPRTARPHLHGNYTTSNAYRLRMLRDRNQLLLFGDCLPRDLSSSDALAQLGEDIVEAFEDAVGEVDSFFSGLFGVERERTRPAPDAVGTESEEEFVAPDQVCPASSQAHTARGATHFTHLNAGTYVRCEDASCEELDRSTRMVFTDSTSFRVNGLTFVRPAPYEAPNPDKNTWGGTFTLDQRPTLAEFNARGYDVRYLHPRNYQLTTGTSRNVFQWPAESSYDYTFTNSGKVVPYGFFYRPDREALQSARSHFVRNESEQQDAWNVNLGFNIGIEGLMSFGLNGSYSQEKETFNASEERKAITMAHEVKYALVLDKARTRLDPEFVARIDRLRDRLIAGRSVNRSDYMGLINSFGTHYPYAVTYGGMAYSESTVTAREVAEAKCTEFQIENEASATMEGVSMGRTIGGGSRNCDSLRNSMEDMAGSVQTVGGEITLDGGWSLPDRSEVPVFLDLRPQYELLSPLYFDDRIVWTVLRDGLKETFERLEEGLAAEEAAEFTRFYEVKVAGLLNLNSGEIDGDAEFSGAFSISGKTGAGDEFQAIEATDRYSGGVDWVWCAGEWGMSRCGSVVSTDTGATLPINTSQLYGVPHAEVCAGATLHFAGAIIEEDAALDPDDLMGSKTQTTRFDRVGTSPTNLTVTWWEDEEDQSGPGARLSYSVTEITSELDLDVLPACPGS